MPGASAAGRLSEELSGDGDWESAWVETLREKKGGGAEAPRAERLTEGLILRGLGRRAEAEASWAAALRDETAPDGVKGRAGLELGYSRWRRGDAEGAAAAFKVAYLEAAAPEEFWEAGAALRRALAADKALRRREAATWEQLQTVCGAWPDGVRHRVRVRMERPGGSWARKAARWPGRALVAVYRSQISPAIGSRCSLWPSCSAYFLEATRRHGLAGIPMGADRLVREPGVVQSGESWIELPDGRWRIADPVEAHDKWWRKEMP